MCGGVAAIDYDNDGRMDLFFTNGARLPELVKTTPDFYNCLLRNRGDGTFEDVTVKAGLTDPASASVSVSRSPTTTTMASTTSSSVMPGPTPSITTKATVPSLT